MNAAVGLLPAVDPVQAVHAWRGRCIGLFAQAELAATEVLAFMAEADPAIPLPHLYGARLVALCNALTARTEARAAAAAVGAMQSHDRLRNFLCHGMAHVLPDRQYGWTVLFRRTSLNKNKAERDIMLVTAADAEAMAEQLRRHVQRMEDCLRPFLAIAGSASPRIFQPVPGEIG